MSRIVYAIIDSRLGQHPLHSIDTCSASLVQSHDAVGTHPLTDAVQQAISGVGERRNHVAVMRILSFLAILAGVVLLIKVSRGFGDWVLGMEEEIVGVSQPRLDWRRWLGERIPTSAGGIDFTAQRGWLVGAIALLVLAEVLLITHQLARHLWSWHQSDPMGWPVASHGTDPGNSSEAIT